MPFEFVTRTVKDVVFKIEAVANVGPISVAVAANIGWQLYHGGVFNPKLPAGQLDHGVAVVGYLTFFNLSPKYSLNQTKKSQFL